jgi:S-formylglutathione hydrolase FrmB
MRTLQRLLVVFTRLIAPVVLAAPAAADSYRVTLDPAARSEPATGRIVLYFITEKGGYWQRVEPSAGPFFQKPQPIASIGVRDFRPGDTVVVDGSSPAAPESIDRLGGAIRVQAVLDADRTERSALAGPGNVCSEVVSAEVAPDREDVIELRLTRRIERRRVDDLPKLENLRWVEVRSEMLSSFYGREVNHRAGVALPRPYLDPASPRREWPVVYLIPGYGGRYDEAASFADMFNHPGIDAAAVMAVWIVLDPESPLGHHGFVDSPLHGPRGTALVRELVPFLESQFRLAPRPEGRIVTGHSSGGWSSLWLQLQHPDVFGACWSSAPDPVDFSAFQMTNIYEDASMFLQPDGSPTPSYRAMVGPGGQTLVTMTVRQEVMMEYAIDPAGCSGEQWDGWAAMFSPPGGEGGCPKRLFDPMTGVIDRSVAAHWSRFDIARLVAGDWERYGPILTGRVRLACGDHDSFYLERAVKKLKAEVDQRRGEASDDAGGYIWIVPFGTHGNLERFTTPRWNREMRAHLKAHGLHD